MKESIKIKPKDIFEGWDTIEMVEKKVIPYLADQEGAPSKLETQEKTAIIAVSLIERYDKNAKHHDGTTTIEAEESELLAVAKAVDTFLENREAFETAAMAIGGIVRVLKDGNLPKLAKKVNRDEWPSC